MTGNGKNRLLTALFVGVLVCVVVSGAVAYARQLSLGLGITGLTRDTPWGLYVGQLAFLVGVAASAVMVVLPYSLHDCAAFAKLTVIGEMLSISALVCAVLFVFVDMGAPARVFNVLMHPAPTSPMFWDFLVLFGYLAVNTALAKGALATVRTGAPPPRWYAPLVYVSIPLAFAIHTVTALLFAGLAARPGWLTAILAPRFLASAFASGPSLLVLLGLFLRRTGRFDVGREALGKLAVIATYALVANVFFAALEVFTDAYSGLGDHREHVSYLFFGLGGRAPLAPWTWGSAALSLVAVAVLIVPRARRNDAVLAFASAAVVASVWMDKGVCLIVSGFVPSPTGEVVVYRPTLPEIAITAGIYAAGALLFLALCRVSLRALDRAAPSRG